jgi:rifampin ADP-ribosylating transferase
VAGLELAGAPHDLTRPPAFAEEVLALEDPVERDWAQASLTWFPLFTSVPEWYVRARLDEMVRVPAVVLREAFRGLLEARPPTRDGPLGVPGLVVWGERDTVLDRAGQEALASALDGGELVVYPRTGHLLLWEQPEQLAGDAVRFVAGLAHGSAPGHRARP